MGRLQRIRELKEAEQRLVVIKIIKCVAALILFPVWFAYLLVEACWEENKWPWQLTG